MQKEIEYEEIVKSKKRVELFLAGLKEKKHDNEIEFNKHNDQVQYGSYIMNQMKIDISLASKHYPNKKDSNDAVQVS